MGIGNPTRRGFLGGLLTLAVAPALFAPGRGLTPLETAVEGLRRTHVERLWTGHHDTSRIFRAIQPLRELRLPPAEYRRALRLAFRMGRRDYLVLCSESSDPLARRLVDPVRLQQWIAENPPMDRRRFSAFG